MNDKVSKGAYKLFRYMKGVKNIEGWLRMGIKWMARHFDVSYRTVLRWLAELRAADWIRSKRRGRAAAGYTIMSHRNVTSKPSHLRKELRDVSPTEKVNHHRDEVGPPAQETPLEETTRIAAGFERVTEGDRRWLKSLGAPADQIRAGVILGRARKLCSKTASEPIRTLRYFAATIAEAATLATGYIEHCRRKLQRIGVAI